MSQAIATFLSLLLLGTVFVSIAWVLTLCLAPEAKRALLARWLLSWSIRGLLMPIILWAIINIGLSFELQPFMPEVQAAKNSGGAWLPAYLRVTGAGLFLISSYWGALTLVWVLASAVRAADKSSRKQFKQLCLAYLLGLSLPAVIVILLGGLGSIGIAATLLLAPIAHYGRDILQPPKLPPIYSRAVARMKFGKYSEAEWEIIKELENCEDDFEGWMMLAELYAKHFNNLAEAEQTVLELCGQPATSPSQVAVALHRLADWHLKLGKNPDAARRVLLMICERQRGTHLAHMAQLRINQLPSTVAELQEQQNAQTIPLPALGDQLDEPAASPIDLNQATKAANAYVEQLRLNPNNATAREKLARLLTERMAKPQHGIEQLELLLEMPDRSTAERARWLELIAAWHLKYARDVESGRKVLERLTREFPETSQAFAARRRLELLDRELKQKLE